MLIQLWYNLAYNILVIAFTLCIQTFYIERVKIKLFFVNTHIWCDSEGSFCDIHVYKYIGDMSSLPESKFFSHQTKIRLFSFWTWKITIPLPPQVLIIISPWIYRDQNIYSLHLLGQFYFSHKIFATGILFFQKKNNKTKHNLEVKWVIPSNPHSI